MIKQEQRLTIGKESLALRQFIPKFFEKASQDAPCYHQWKIANALYDRGEYDLFAQHIVSNWEWCTTRGLVDEKTVPMLADALLNQSKYHNGMFVFQKFRMAHDYIYPYDVRVFTDYEHLYQHLCGDHRHYSEHMEYAYDANIIQHYNTKTVSYKKNKFAALTTVVKGYEPFEGEHYYRKHAIVVLRHDGTKQCRDRYPEVTVKGEKVDRPFSSQDVVELLRYYACDGTEMLHKTYDYHSTEYIIHDKKSIKSHKQYMKLLTTIKDNPINDIQVPEYLSTQFLIKA